MGYESIPFNKVTYAYGSEAEAFPEVDPLVEPCGDKVLVQIRTPKKVTSGGIMLVTETRDAEQWTTQVAKVVAIGPLAFRDRKTMEPWPEGAYAAIGDYVRVPRFGGDRWTVPTPDGENEALMILFRDVDMLGRVKGGWEGALKIKAFI